MEAVRPRFEVEQTTREALAERFFCAFADGNIRALVQFLAADVHLVSDSGGKAPQWGTGFLGAERVAQLLTSLAEPFAAIVGVVERHEVNGQPGAILRSRDKKVVNIWALDIIDGHIQMIRTVLNPDKLGHLGPVSDIARIRRRHEDHAS